ncbi:hypothetical protein CANCADRAFT_110345 [Tortispora caseinolytica NRRL Y-17796]|uniref:AB hydrolase-1 domain-containing protein n=1 Tax=Tortispora caseinolytica NRRL Y-17796 TaxID=767744 RepID=A0A1E4TGB4_9ASCO|nr:hypothetical protein CANCADRAFT_110345 [Tortispora caseinolytica NRRL Y-17796]
MAVKHLQRVPADARNPFHTLIREQTVVRIPKFTLESGIEMYDIDVAYKTWGRLDEQGTNCLVICHALTGSADVTDWWAPLIGPGKAFDISRFFVVCLNTLGSPYGSSSPCTYNPETGEIYGPEFPLVSIRDDVSIHKVVLEDLGVRQIASVIGGSMGGMLTLEWAFMFPDYVRTIVPIATCARHSAWGISWGESQRQAIYSDPKYNDGYYSFDDPPSTGLAAARMSALLTYRSRTSFESRFGRNAADPAKLKTINGNSSLNTNDDSRSWSPARENWEVHNEGHMMAKRRSQTPSDTSEASSTHSSSPPSAPVTNDSNTKGSAFPLNRNIGRRARPTQTFSAQSYLRYQGQKFVARFDANCYIAMTRKLDTHDVSRGRNFASVGEALATLTQPALVVGIESDGLFTFEEQKELAGHIPNAILKRIESPEGHDAFLIEFELMNNLVKEFLDAKLPEIVSREPIAVDDIITSSVKPLIGESDDESGHEITRW